MSNNQNIDAEQLAGMFKALSNPNRLRIFLCLVSCGALGTVACCDSALTKCVGELGKDLRVGASTVSHHIKELRRAGLIHVERDGQNIRCWVDRPVLRRLAEFFGVPTCG